MRIHDHQLFETRARNREANFGPRAQSRFRRERAGPCSPEMFVRLADGLNRQDQQIKVRRASRPHRLKHAFSNQRVRAHGQMRAMLLDGRGWENGDRALRVERVEFRHAQIGPVTCGHVSSFGA